MYRISTLCDTVSASVLVRMRYKQAVKQIGGNSTSGS
jgi:hypothetical protein